jgi:pimeloyl-ACP methyl ester carboxylesterase
MRSWTKYITYFIGSSNVIIADLPGAGDADTMKIGEFNLYTLAEMVDEIICRTNSDKVDIIAASYGAGIAYSFARNYPDKVNHLTVAGVISKLPEETKIKIERSVEYLKNNEMRLFSNLMIESLLNSKYKSKILNYGIIERLLRYQFNSLSSNEKEKYIHNAHHLLSQSEIEVKPLSEIKKLVVTGEYDILTEPQSGREIASILSNCIFTTIKNADHLFHLEQLETTLALIKGFFQEVPLESLPGINRVEYY